MESTKKDVIIYQLFIKNNKMDKDNKFHPRKYKSMRAKYTNI
jgi:hypothetical protein